ncbi:GerW family sporulation protein [Defluviitalea saccharophila]|uniref:Spore germination protein GerW family protein n=1 Tax=Defluviitalea saccharophila TaxID=879970 RepID=A0ABZ2Y6V8_9FIRM|nr:sporulation protein [Candidatus Epulonipiscium sp.]
MESNLKNSFESLFGQLENFISTKTVVGEPIHIEDAILLPLVDVTFGVGAGASGGKNEKGEDKDSGVGGLGARITPSAMLLIKDGTAQLINVKNQDSINKLIDMIPGLLSKFNFGSKKDKEKDRSEESSSDYEI